MKTIYFDDTHKAIADSASYAGQDYLYIDHFRHIMPGFIGENWHSIKCYSENMECYLENQSMTGANRWDGN